MPETGARGAAGGGDGEPGMETLKPMAGIANPRDGREPEMGSGLGEVSGRRGRVELVPGKQQCCGISDPSAG